MNGTPGSRAARLCCDLDEICIDSDVHGGPETRRVGELTEMTDSLLCASVPALI